MQYVLMCKDTEVLEFDIDVSDNAVGNVRLLEGAACAPFGLLENPSQREWLLEQFLDDRCIGFSRTDLPAILKATGARNQLELALRSGGFSLSDPYWYRAQNSTLSWAHSNFFDNDWDLAFGDAVLRKDYHALKKASVFTPDVTCGGASRKAWVSDDDGIRLFKAPLEEGSASVLGEVLMSRMLARLLPEDEFVSYKMEMRNGETYSASRAIVGAGEELSMAWQAESAMGRVSVGERRIDELLGLELLEEFEGALLRLGVEKGNQVKAKMALITHLAFNRDMHVRNLGVIRNVDTGELRLAPFFDFDRVFGLSQRDRMKNICERPQVAALMVANLFSYLDPSWDYSWYDPHALDDFEDEIERTLCTSTDIPQGYAHLIARLFVSQRAYVNRVVSKRR